MPLLLVLPLLVALVMNQKFRGRNLFRAMYFAPYVLGVAGAFEIQRRPDAESVRFEKGESEALIRGLESKRLASTRPVEVEHRPNVELVRSRITGVDLRPESDAGPDRAIGGAVLGQDRGRMQ